MLDKVSVTKEIKTGLKQFCKERMYIVNRIASQAIYDFLKQHETDTEREFWDYMEEHAYQDGMYVSTEQQEWLDQLSKEFKG